MRGIVGIITALAALTLFGCDNPFPKLDANCQVGVKSDGGTVRHCQFLNYGSAPASGCIQVKVKPTKASPEGGASEIVSEKLCMVDIPPITSLDGMNCATSEDENVKRCGEPANKLSNYECVTDKNAPDYDTCKARSLELDIDMPAVQRSCIINKDNKRVFTCSLVIEDVTAR